MITRKKQSILCILLTSLLTIICADSEQSLFAIRKDVHSPWSQLLISVPRRHPLYESFIAKLTDVSEGARDSDKTFLSSSDEVIRVNALLPGHRYSIAIHGQTSSGSTELIKEESMTMDPRAPDFRGPDSEIQIAEHNITMRTMKNSTYLQDSFTIEYRQISPEKKFPVLQVLDIPEQRSLEFYLGNLNSGLEYSIRVTAHKDGMTSRPWIATVVTRPEPLKELKLEQQGGCVDMTWTFGDGSASDFVVFNYAMVDDPSPAMSNMTIPATETSISICDMIAGQAYQVNAIVQKGDQVSTTKRIEPFQLRPLAPIDFRVRADIKRAKYKLLAELPTTSRIDKCQIIVTGDNIDRRINEASVETTKSGHRICWYNFALVPGERYDFSISSVARNATSQKLQKSVVLPPAFDFNSFGLTVQETESGASVEWPRSEVFMSRLKDVWHKVVGSESRLVVRLRNSTTTKQFDTTPTASAKLLLPDLVKGSCYTIQLYTVTKTGIISEHRHNETIRMSGPAVNVTLASVTKSSATIKFAYSVAEDSQNIAENCHISVIVRDVDGNSIYDKRSSLSIGLTPIVSLDGLKPFHKYTVNTQIICGGGDECGASPSTRTMRQLSFSTRQSVPTGVQSLNVEPLNAYSALVSWLPPAMPNGILTRYVVTIAVASSDETRSIDVGVASNRSDNAIQVVVDELRGGKIYSFDVRAATEAGVGEQYHNIPVITMPLQAPPKPSALPQIDVITSTAITVRFPANFDDRNGDIKRYAVLISETTTDASINRWLESDNATYTWLQVQKFDVWPTYMALIRDVDKNSRNPQIIEEIGIDDCSSEENRVDRVCNGPLKSSTRYRVRLRIFTAPNMFSDSDYSQTILTGSVAPSLSVVSILVCLACVIAAALTATAVIVCWNRSKKARLAAYKNGPSKEKESQWEALKMMMAERAADCLAKLGIDGASSTSGSPTPTTTTVTDGAYLGAPFTGQHRRTRSLRERTGVEHRLERLASGPIHRTPLYTVVTGVNTNKTRPVRIADFSEHVRIMSADSDFRFSEEYEMLKNLGVGQSSHASEMAVNRVKNRFTNILAYDHSRVRLSLPDNGIPDVDDYINANYMPGFSSRHEFIAAQGPLPSTRDEFWQMTWEQRCPAIVALTKCVEKGRDKCHQYWPDGERGVGIYGDIEVAVLSENHFDEFVVRDIRLTKRGEEPRIIRHWHYTAWPDFGVPQHPAGIISFVQMFRQHLPHSPHNMPTIVHCSAGVGRSGTFIAIDRMLQAIAVGEPTIDIFGIVCEMRMERCQMVQNEQQYIFIHLCILHSLNLSSSSPTSSRNSGAHSNSGYVQDATIVESGF